LPLQGIKPVGSDLSDTVVIQTLDSAGRTVDSYLWIDYAGESGDEEAWVDPDTYEIVDSVTFASGAGLWIQGASSEQGIQSAGKVGKTDVNVTLRYGGTVTGNPTPVSVDLQDILPTGDDLSDTIVIQTLDSAGRTVDSYLWIDYAGESGDEEAWVDPDTYEIVQDVTFAPGAGLWVQADSTNQGIQFPAPEL